MTPAGAPRLGGGIAASVLLHAGAAAALVFLSAPRHEAPTPPLYRVQLLAAPAGPRSVGVVQPPASTPLPPPEVIPPKAAPAKPVPKVTPKAKPKTSQPPKAATPVPQQKTAPQPKTETPQPTAAAGETGGKGADVAQLDTPGIEFPYPAYLQNIAREIIKRFQSEATRLTLTADVRFLIRRDGSVDPNSIGLARSSGNYPFDQKALGAVEAAANSRRFGPLPPGFREDILPVIFRFTPALR